MYLFAGSLTILWGGVIFFLLPDSPSSPGRFFTADERVLLLQRAKRNQTGLDRKPFRLSQVKEAGKDVKIWLFFLMGSAIYVSFFLSFPSPSPLGRFCCAGKITIVERS